MAGTGGRNAIGLHVLRALPVAVPVLLSIAALIALEVSCRALGLRLHLCDRCVVRQRRRRVMLISALVLAFVVLAAVLYLIPTVPLFDRKWGILFAPWVLLAALLAAETPLAGMRVHPLSNGVQRVRGASALTQGLQREHPELLAVDVQPRFWPSRLELYALLMPAGLAAIAETRTRCDALSYNRPGGMMSRSPGDRDGMPDRRA